MGAAHELEGFAAVMETVRNKAVSLKDRALSGPHDYEQIPGLVDRGRKRVADFYTDLEARLQQSRFVAGDQFSAADITAIVTIDFATKALELPIPAESKATHLWYDASAARPSIAA